MSKQSDNLFYQTTGKAEEHNMDEYVTRVATPEDAPPVEDLLKTSYPVLMAGAYDEATLAPLLALITKANMTLLTSGTYHVAETRDGSLVGCGGWTIEKPPGVDGVAGDAGHLRHFATHPDWTRRGIGRAIYRQCEAAARSARVATLEVCSSLNGEPFYAAQGFERIQSISVAIGPYSFPGVLMRRVI